MKYLRKFNQNLEDLHFLRGRIFIHLPLRGRIRICLFLKCRIQIDILPIRVRNTGMFFKRVVHGTISSLEIRFFQGLLIFFDPCGR